MNSINNKILALIISMVLGFVVLGASVFIADNSDHDCIGAECSTCMAIEQCENTINALGLAVGGAFTAFLISFVILQLITVKSESKVLSSTLISLKVELLS